MTYYDDIAEGYEELHREEQLKKVALIRKHVTIQPNELLLDVGCGTGITALGWETNTFALDPAIKLLEKAHEKDKVKYINAEAENIPFKNNIFDWVISITAIQNFYDLEAGLKEIKRVGKERFVLSFLKNSQKAEKIKQLIEKHFKVKQIIEEDKDLIFII